MIPFPVITFLLGALVAMLAFVLVEYVEERRVWKWEPAPDPYNCRCNHAKNNHSQGSSLCFVGFCGCQRFTKGTKKIKVPKTSNTHLTDSETVC